MAGFYSPMDTNGDVTGDVSGDVEDGEGAELVVEVLEVGGKLA